MAKMRKPTARSWPQTEDMPSKAGPGVHSRRIRHPSQRRILSLAALVSFFTYPRLCAHVNPTIIAGPQIGNVVIRHKAMKTSACTTSQISLEIGPGWRSWNAVASFHRNLNTSMTIAVTSIHLKPHNFGGMFGNPLKTSKKWHRNTLVGVRGFEPRTSSSRTMRATRLRYTP